ncbi:MAG: hypothetical protein NC305_12575 [Lachnospiraceae bacterium]|nr:hypothetical protein [Butyrivibrio sp.]MCM1344176.1 hypothetical protein [Muribaculaceae bacterium]MCM1411367.1 hypothetical protein [Lachnospiraceae bacterium]
MRQTLTFHDSRNNPKDSPRPRDIRLEILASGIPGDCASFTVDITDMPDSPDKEKSAAITVTLDRKTGRPEVYTLPLKNGGACAADWFDRIETVASDAPMEFSEERFSVCDTLGDITADGNAFRILADAMYSMSGIKMTRPLAAMLGDRTLLELASALDPAGGSGTGKKAPENALQIINAELNKVKKGSRQRSSAKAGKRSGISAQ